MTPEALLQQTAKATGLELATVTAAVFQLFAELQAVMASNRSVHFPDFGTFARVDGKAWFFPGPGLTKACREAGGVGRDWKMKRGRSVQP